MEVARAKRSKTLKLSSFFSGSLSSATISPEKEEEEAMAKCLILLAQGHASTQLEIHKRPRQTAMGEEHRAFAGKLHECSICGLEFASGKALGGHKRRHRAFSRRGTRSYSSHGYVGKEMKQRNVLQFDLNLPAPEEAFREPRIQFVGSQQSLVFSGPAPIDCHY